MVLPPSPQVRLVPRTPSATARSWPVDLPESGSWKVTGAAGSGVSSFLIDTVIHALDRAQETGADPSGILVIAPSKESGARLRRELSERLENYAAQTSMVRSVHSLAFALLRTAAE
ncbi:MAG: ATP-dependent helicase, partial [Cutibacterium acnes]